ncbi:LbetaH domain-containing protein [Tautonia sociabilis]|uniref:Acyl-ACP--UDP-N-acetylglucosamine O-acyltransferase n=1 Tax=Tautonia sociabilis TaxID=2080755 RepID=A0A432MS65_9BACT|nr:acyl-ACP--UDP-N-acetylglucosamine O-acyltransferase [Tautonia sociabilis]RUL89748.1 acyl-ACP--UDP-N-acetylglucosamine O-acyltransferase [Tautonia sociabilis]
MAMRIADTATVDPRAELADGVEVGPYCVIGPGARLGPGTRLIAHVCLLGPVRLGSGNVVSPFCVIGAPASDAEAAGRVEVGDDNVIREGCSIEAGSGPDGETRIGSRTRIDPHVSIARDAWIGDGVALGAGARIGSRAAVEAFAVVGAGAVLHPAVTVGEHSDVTGPVRIARDVPRYMRIDGPSALVRGVNLIGLLSRGFSRSAIRALREASRLLDRAGLDPTDAGRRLVDRGEMTPEVARLLESHLARQGGRHGRARDAGRRDPGPGGVGNSFRMPRKADE